MAKAKVQMKEILSQFVDVLIEDELEALRSELTKFRGEIQVEIGKFKKSITDDIENFKKSSSKDLLKIKETIALMKTELTTAKSAQAKRFDDYSTKMMNTLEEREAIMETNLKTLATQVGESISDQTEDFNLAIKELSKRVESAEKISLLLNNFASGISSVAKGPGEAQSDIPPISEKKIDNKIVKKTPQALKSGTPTGTNMKVESRKMDKKPELVVEDAFLDEKLAMEIDSAQIIPPLPKDIEGHKVNPIKVDEVSGQQLYVP